MPSTWSKINLHIIFSTKHHQPLITEAMRERLYPFIGGIVRDERGVLLTIGGMPDHLHLLVGWNTQASIGDLMRHVKTRSSKWVHDEFTADFARQEGYGAFSVSQSQLDTVKTYIDTSREELLAFLKANHVEFRDEYLD